MGELVKVCAVIVYGIWNGIKKAAVFIVSGFCFLWRKFSKYCMRHNYKPRTVLCTILALVLVVAGAAFARGLIERNKALTSGLGLANIGELATQAYHYRVVDSIEKSQELWGWDVPLTSAQTIFSYEGLIRAGYNFEDIKIDVDYDNKRIAVTLPNPYIINNDIIADSLMVYSEDTNIFTPISVEDFNDAQKDMRGQGEADAIKIGIYDAARTNAEVLIKGFLSGAFDLDEFEIVFE